MGVLIASMKRYELLLLALMLAACNLAAEQPAVSAIPEADLTASSTLPLPVLNETITPKGKAPTGAAAPTQTALSTGSTPTPAPAEAAALPRPLPQETILILSPGPGSRLTTPIRVNGVAGPVFDQALSVRVISADGQELAIAPAQIDADLGQRGPFAVDIAISVNEVLPAFIQIYAGSPRDGGITHLSAIDVTLAPRGAPDIKPLISHLERILIDHPAPGETIRGGKVRVQGFGLASFEQTLVVEIIGPDGTLAGSQSLIVDSPESGKPGPFSVDVLYAASAGLGRIVIRDPSPAFDGDLHVSSVEVNLEP